MSVLEDIACLAEALRVVYIHGVRAGIGELRAALLVIAKITHPLRKLMKSHNRYLCVVSLVIVFTIDDLLRSLPSPAS